MFTKLAALVAAFTVLIISTPAQQSFSRSLGEAPALAGFKLGMSIEQTQAVLGSRFKIPKKKTGGGSFFQNFTGEQTPQSLSGVHALFLRFFDFKLYQIELFYEDAAKPNKLDEFIQTLSADLALPANWNIEHHRAAIDCGDFTVTADTTLNPHVELTDDAAYDAFKAKHEGEKKQKKKS
jgi:hypothetical protein